MLTVIAKENLSVVRAGQNDDTVRRDSERRGLRSEYATVGGVILCT